MNWEQQALFSLRPNARTIVIVGDEVTQYDHDLPFPTQEELTAEASRLEALYNSNKYQRDRAVIYPSVQDQLDMLYWDAINGSETWKSTITQIKQSYPKSGE
jgi:hypothetical protein